MDNVAEVIKHGVISSVDPVKATARVTFADRDNVVSYDLPVIQHNAGFAKFYSMPQVGQNALCVFLGTGMEDGFIIGSFYNDEKAPPATSADIHMIEFEDGSKIEYSNGVFNIVGNVVIDGLAVAKDFITDGGISLTSHKTSGVQPGSGTSGVPVP